MSRLSLNLLALIESWINEHGSSEILKERLESMRDEVKRLLEENTKLKGENENLLTENKNLKEQLNNKYCDVGPCYIKKNSHGE